MRPFSPQKQIKVKGFPDGGFHPAENIRRCDYVILLARMVGFEGSKADAGVESFTDVRRDAYYYQTVMKARELGIAQGREDNRFDPEEPITRQEMVVFTMRALEKTAYLTMKRSTEGLDRFGDSSQVGTYAVEYMKTAIANGLIQGDEHMLLNPARNTARAEAAVFVARLYDARRKS